MRPAIGLSTFYSSVLFEAGSESAKIVPAPRTNLTKSLKFGYINPTVGEAPQRAHLNVLSSVILGVSRLWRVIVVPFGLPSQPALSRCISVSGVRCTNA